MASVTKEELQNYANQIKNGGADAVIKVYDELYKKGFKYAGWAAA